jgi:hypothetical protein
VIMAANDGERKAARLARVGLPPRVGGGVFGSGGSGVSFGSASNFASAARSGSSRGARGNQVVFDGAPDRRRYGGVLVVGKINRRHGLAASQPLSSKTFDPALHGGLIVVRHVHHPDHY